jgi:transcriptional regulator GlxA family with amidase domain
VKKGWADPKVLFLAVCTGSLVLAQIGVLDGYHVASNKIALKMVVDAGKLNKAVHWVGDARWVKDGRVWSAAGVTAGIDLAAEFARTFFDLEVVEFAKVISEEVVHSDRPDQYAWVLEGVDLGAGK